MSTRALVVLEDLRRDEVEHARRALAALRSSHASASTAAQAAAAGQARCEHELTRARDGFAGARTVFALRAAEAVLCVGQNALARAVHRREQSLLSVAESTRALALGEARLRSLEVARRSVARTLEQRAADVRLRTERRLEDESDDAFRAQFHGPAGAAFTRAGEPRAVAHAASGLPARGARGLARSGSH